MVKKDGNAIRDEDFGVASHPSPVQLVTGDGMRRSEDEEQGIQVRITMVNHETSRLDYVRWWLGQWEWK